MGVGHLPGLANCPVDHDLPIWTVGGHGHALARLALHRHPALGAHPHAHALLRHALGCGARLRGGGVAPDPLQGAIGQPVGVAAAPVRSPCGEKIVGQSVVQRIEQVVWGKRTFVCALPFYPILFSLYVLLGKFTQSLSKFVKSFTSKAHGEILHKQRLLFVKQFCQKFKI